MRCEKVAKIHPEDTFLRKGTRDTDHPSDIASDNSEVRQKQHRTQIFGNSSEQMIQENVYCRICLQSRKQGNRLLRPCQCRDPIHELCLLEWVERRMEATNEEASSLKCEICKSAYSLPFEPYECFTCEIANPKYHKFRGEFAKSLIGFLLLAVIFSLTTALLFKICLDKNFSAQTESLLALPKNTIVAISAMVLLFSGALGVGVGYRTVRHYCYGVRWRVGISE